MKAERHNRINRGMAAAALAAVLTVTVLLFLILYREVDLAVFINVRELIMR